MIVLLLAHEPRRLFPFERSAPSPRAVGSAAPRRRARPRGGLPQAWRTATGGTAAAPEQGRGSAGFGPYEARPSSCN